MIFFSCFRFDLSAVDIGLFGYGEEIHTDTLIKLGSVTNYAELYFLLLTKVQAKGDLLGTKTDVAIEYIRKTMFGDSYSKKKLAIVVTDGQSANPVLTGTVCCILASL